MLKVENLDAYYGDMVALRGVSLEVNKGEIVSLVGANAAGKTTLIQAISGMLERVSGHIYFEGQAITGLPAHRIVRLGIVQVPEGRRLFPFMTVLENLELGAYPPEAKRKMAETMEAVFELLPILKERRSQRAGSLSGGEQQMLAIGRGLMAQPKLMMLDEPSLGLAPISVQMCFEIVRQIHDRGTTVLLVEQNVRHALTIANRGYVLESGRIVMEGTGDDLLHNDGLRKAYMGM